MLDAHGFYFFHLTVVLVGFLLCSSDVPIPGDLHGEWKVTNFLNSSVVFTV